MRPQPQSDEAQLRLDEGEVYHMYKDSKGIETIGVGHNLQTTPLSKYAVSQILTDDIQNVRERLRLWPVWSVLDPVRQGVLVNLSFWLGVDGLLGFHKMLTYATNKDYEKAADEIENSTLPNTDIGRANRLATQMRTGIRQ